MRIGVFCGSLPGGSARYAAVTRELAGELARRGIGLVYGGGRVGLMGVLGDAMLTAGGEVVGVMPRHLVDREIAHPGLTELRVVESMHARKAVMAELSDGFVALPGGAGTLDELFEAWTWAQLGLHRSPCGLLDVDGYFGHLLAFLDHATAEGFLPAGYRASLQVAAEPAALLDAFAGYVPPLRKWSEATHTDLR